MKSGANVLYLTYDGLTDPLGQSQVLPYLEGLSALGHRITILSCEKPDAFAAGRADKAERCARAGIDWQPLRYRKWPPVLSTVTDLAFMAYRAARIVGQGNIDIVHCRSYLTALIGLHHKRRGRARFLFDMRGFWIDERFERGIWNDANPIYRTIATWLRKRERDFFASADAVVSLTHAARDELGRRDGEGWSAKTKVIPCCVDLDLFDPKGGGARTAGRALLGLDEGVPLLLFLGSLGGAYPLDPVFRFFRHWSAGREGARLLFVTRHAANEIFAHPCAAEIADQLIVRPGERAEVPLLVAAADTGLSFILPSFCAIASSPTKVGEMLAMGIPIAANAGVGDMARILAEPGAGVLLPDLSDQAIAKSAQLIWQCTSRAQPRAAAQKWFALDSAVATYDEIYRRLAVATSSRGNMASYSEETLFPAQNVCS